MDEGHETNEKPKEDDIGIPVVPLVLGGMLATGPMMGSGMLPFIGGNFVVDKTEDKSGDHDEEEDELKR